MIVSFNKSLRLIVVLHVTLLSIKAGFENQANPHKTHPNLELYIGSKSPHPMKEVGCTVCHGGEGHRVTDFNAAAHTPRDENNVKNG